ncbi:type III-B CRISPR module-associated protein Cmr5 [Alicyclobacillus vulcanalis]|uniref:CRISPR type III-B/RAMP module-associated protein Cmr5 n=1 Tax=Alicyclobacillus vulcanalis TaxID=252246 RepID=A0A1N7K6M1_9BACL|nr:type III-B CRISPR module-associated protein Cmr5 [Alicyclobacillus vulcanalis]SIS57232.1 CRISPR-associated protein, Cmr5 family [Alicyclobacillus vulcanalis]
MDRLPVDDVQPRAAQFLQTAQELVDQVEACVRAEYASLVRGLPALLHQSGLFQTVAYLESRAGRASAHSLVLTHLSKLLRAFTGMEQITTTKLAKMKLHEVVVVSRLALEAATWLKRMVEILVGDEEGAHA